MENKAVKKMDISSLDALLKVVVESPAMPSSNKLMVDDLAFFVAFLIDPPQQFVENGTLQALESLADEVESFVSSFDLKKMNKVKAKEICMQLVKLLIPVKDWKNEVQLIYEEVPKPSRSYYPRTSPIFFIDHLLENLEELVNDTDSSTRPLNHFISRIQRKLQFWNSRLVEISEPRNNPFNLKDLLESIRNLAYEVEYVIDSFLVGDFPIWHSMFWLLNILHEFEHVEPELTVDSDVVGFEEETRDMLRLLKSDLTQLTVISILGLGGMGKTKLAITLYTEPSVIQHFEARAWCHFSQQFNKRQSLLELLRQIAGFSSAIHHETEEELSEMLYKCLKGRRFLVVLDDIWSSDVWDDLRRCFPDDCNGSKIVFTTRLQELASQPKLNSILYLSLLSEDESWELLRKMTFKKESCPPELYGAGRKIATKCQGLPLSIILTARFLASMEKTVGQWEYIAENFMSDIDGNTVSGVIKLSYDNLPDYLKQCFLYFGVLLQNSEISVSKLIRLWIAEGFIKHTVFKSLEDVAEEYLMHLIGKSLVKVVQEKSTDGVKSCRAATLFHDFTVDKAREDNFLQLIDGHDEPFNFSNDGLDPDSSYSSSTSKIYQTRRLCIYSNMNDFSMLKPSGPFVQSLLFPGGSNISRSSSHDISFIFHNFKFLRTLDLEKTSVGVSFQKIDVLVLLRYLAVQSTLSLIPASIGNLWNLETFIFKGLRGEVVLPNSIWNMTKLRHLHVNSRASFGLETHRLENSTTLDNLQTFSTPILSYGDDMEKILRRLRGIRKLKCRFLDSWDDAKDCNRFPVLEFLNELVSLKVFYNGMGKYPCEFNFPSKLKKLTLSFFQMPWNAISQLATLCNLEVLKLLSNAFKGETWEMKDECFPKLKFLKLEALDVVTWSATKDHFPCLKRLLVHKCKSLVNIPLDFTDIETLEMIEVMWCNPSVANSARKIKAEQVEYGKDTLKVHSEFDLEPSS